MHINHVAHWYILCCIYIMRCSYSISTRTAREETSCLTQQICTPILSILLTRGEVKTFNTRSMGIRGPVAQQDTSLSTLAFPVCTILLLVLQPLQGGDKSVPEHKCMSKWYTRQSASFCPSIPSQRTLLNELALSNIVLDVTSHFSFQLHSDVPTVALACLLQVSEVRM